MHERYKSLKNYVEHLNLWSELHNEGEVYEYPVKTRHTAQVIFAELESDLSPENLHCDGEITNREANAKLKAILKIASLLHNSGFAIPEHSELTGWLDEITDASQC